jgi:hypothetical protein
MDNQKMQALATALATQQPGQPMLGQGLAQNAANSIQTSDYRRHVQEAQAMGQPPMNPQEFMQMNMGQR